MTAEAEDSTGDQSPPKDRNVLGQFDEKARTRVNRSVAKAEKKTTAEIVPVVARASGNYERAEDLVGLWLAVILLGVVWFPVQGVSEDVGWSGESAVRLGFWWVLATLLIGFIGGVVLANRIDWLRRLFVPGRDMERTAVARAKAVFFERRIHRTSRATGVLIYVSLFERHAVVLVDDAVAEKLGESDLDKIRDAVIGGLKEGDLAGGLISGVGLVGKLLGKSLPARKGRVDEVSGEVVILN